MFLFLPGKVVVEHGLATGLTRTVSVEVYLTYDGAGGAPVVGESSTMLCNYETDCPEKTDCGGDSTEVQVNIYIYICIFTAVYTDFRNCYYCCMYITI